MPTWDSGNAGELQRSVKPFRLVSGFESLLSHLKNKKCPRGCGKTLKIPDGEHQQPIIYNHYQKECPIKLEKKKSKGY